MDIKDCYELGVDFMSIQSGHIYCIADYKKAKENGFPVPGCIIKTPEGKEIGIIREDKMQEILK